MPAADRPADPYPLMRLDYVLEALKLRFGTDNVMEDKGRVTLKLKYPGGQAPAFVSLMVEQAKFLVAHSISAKDLVDENYPPSWPGGPDSPSQLARFARKGAEPVSFTPTD
jgi:hypothetical protein